MSTPTRSHVLGPGPFQGEGRAWSTQTVRLANVPPQPWRNGGGITHELLAWPGAGDWRVRVSVATIAADGPFSAFPGVQRWFAVLEGAGVRLQHAQGERRCSLGDEPWPFDGADAPGCTLIDGPTRDLNLMLRGTGALRRGTVLTGAWPWRAAYTPEAVTLHVGGTAHALPAASLFWSDDPAPAQWRSEAPLFFLVLDPTAP